MSGEPPRCEVCSMPIAWSVILDKWVHTRSNGFGPYDHEAKP